MSEFKSLEQLHREAIKAPVIHEKIMRYNKQRHEELVKGFNDREKQRERIRKKRKFILACDFVLCFCLIAIAVLVIL